MRAQPSEYELVAPGKLSKVLDLLAREPGVWLPIAGGTEVMVQYGAGRLGARKLVSLWGLPELRRIERTGQELIIGAGCTYSDLRSHPVVAQEFPLLARAASWTGSIANQNRGTLGGNIVNASPAADSLPALLVYEAELLLISARGPRRMPYGDFHTGYKQTRLAPDEIISGIALQARFAGYHAYSRKVGHAQRASHRQALPGWAGQSRRQQDRRHTACHRQYGSHAVTAAAHRRGAAWPGVESGLDCGSTAGAGNRSCSHRRHSFQRRLPAACCRQSVAGVSRGSLPMNLVLVRWHALPRDDAAQEILSCCGSRAWAARLAAMRPFVDEPSLFAAADRCWWDLPEADWLEAFRSHPRIGEKHARNKTTAASAAWSSAEQSQMKAADAAILLRMQQGHLTYEERFGRIFIVCASGKQPAEMLQILEQRLSNDPAEELLESAAQQQQIMQLRLRKWLAGPGAA